MLGHGAIGQFAIGQFGTGTGAGAETITVDKWYIALSEPVRTKPGLAARNQQVIAFQPTPIINITWFEALSDPVRIKIGLAATQQEFLTAQNINPLVSFGWFESLTEPVRIKPRLHESLQKFISEGFAQPVLMNWFAAWSEPVRIKSRLLEDAQQFTILDLLPTVLLDWFANLSEPVRLKIGLRKELQEVLSRAAFVPTSYLARLDVTEQGDLFLAALNQFNIPLSAYVDIVENDPRKRGYLGIIASAPQSSILTGIVEPQTVPSTGSPVSTVAGARVAIITG